MKTNMNNYIFLIQVMLTVKCNTINMFLFKNYIFYKLLVMSKIASVIKSIAPRKYVYTFANHKNQFVDPRFKVKQVSRILNKNEVEHINSTIDDAFREF